MARVLAFVVFAAMSRIDGGQVAGLRRRRGVAAAPSALMLGTTTMRTAILQSRIASRC